MSSPPPPPSSLTSFPQPNPRKRPSLASVSSQQSISKKARMHPLRQTSFPANADSDPRVFSASAASDAGSVTGSFTGSLADGLGTTGKKRGRKKKDQSERGSVVDGARGTRPGSADADGGSVRNGPAGAQSRVGADDEDDEDIDEEAEGELMGGDDEGHTDTEAEKKNLAVLVDAFNSEQSSRYDMFKRAKLRKETVRKIANQTLSQSVPPSVITTINGYTKVFVGEIIELARTVQAEWAEAADQAAIAAAQAEEAEAERNAAEAAAKKAEADADAATAAQAAADAREASESPAGNGDKTPAKRENGSESRAPTPSIPPPAFTSTPYPNASYPPLPSNSLPASPSILSPSMPTPSQSQTLPASQNDPSPSNGYLPSSQEKEPFKLPPNPHRAQLLPDHLREALRRYKVNGEGGGVGFSGLSLNALGAKGHMNWGLPGSGGRRLFK